MPDAPTSQEGGNAPGSAPTGLPERVDGRSPPLNDLELERALVTTAQQDPSARKKLAKLIYPYQFSDAECRTYFTGVLKNSVFSVPFVAPLISPVDLENAAERLSELAYRRDVLLHSASLRHLAVSGDLDGIDHMLRNTPRYGGNRAHVSYLDQITKNVLSRSANQEMSISLKDPRLAPLGLWFAARTMHIFAARSGVGKSVLLEQIVLDLLSQGYSVLDINVEMPEELRYGRYLQQLSRGGFTAKQVVQQLVPNNQLLDTINRFRYRDYPKNETPNIYGMYTLRTNLPDVLAQIHQFCDDYEKRAAFNRTLGLSTPGPPVVVIDYVQKLSHPRINDGFEKMELIRQELFDLMHERGCVVLLVAQFKTDNFELTSKPDYMPTRAQIEYGSRLVQDATGVYLIHKPLGAWQNGPQSKRLFIFDKLRMDSLPEMPSDGIFDGMSLSYDFRPTAVKMKTLPGL